MEKYLKIVGLLRQILVFTSAHFLLRYEPCQGKMSRCFDHGTFEIQLSFGERKHLGQMTSDLILGGSKLLRQPQSPLGRFFKLGEEATKSAVK